MPGYRPLCLSLSCSSCFCLWNRHALVTNGPHGKPVPGLPMQCFAPGPSIDDLPINCFGGARPTDTPDHSTCAWVLFTTRMRRIQRCDCIILPATTHFEWRVSFMALQIAVSAGENNTPCVAVQEYGSQSLRTPGLNGRRYAAHSALDARA